MKCLDRNIKRVIILLIYFLIGILLMTKCDFWGQYGLQFVVLICSYFIVAGILVYSMICKRLDIFEPIVLVFLLLLGIFSIGPILLTSSGKVSLYGVNFMGGCIKTTVLYILCCLSFFVGYYNKKYKNYSIIKGEYSIKVNGSKKIFNIMVFIWIFCFFIGIFYEWYAYGISFKYILTLGMVGTVKPPVTDTAIGFLSNFTYSLVIPWLYIMFFSHNKYIKIIITVCTNLLYIMMGARFILIIISLSYIIIYFIINNKRPSFKLITIFLLCSLIFISVLGSTRRNLRYGGEVEVSLLNTNNMIQALESNFNIYQPLYGIVEKFPSKYSYTCGESMIFDTIITFLPRMIWKNKPLARNFAVPRAMRLSLGDSVIDKAAMAIPNIGEFYLDFGYLGAMIIMFFYGKILMSTTQLYKKKENNLTNIILYSILYSINFQLVIRGYTPSNFYLFIFMIWPYFFIRKYEKKEERKKN